MNILLVESSPLYREILQQSFKRFRGLTFSTAEGRAEALAMTGQSSFDFVVVSGQLSDGDGLELAGQLRAMGLVPIAPIVLLTGSPSSELARHAEQVGITEIFRKQDLDELVAFARHFLEARQPLRCRILYVEDASDQRQALSAQLREWGITVDAYASADEAWPAFLENEYDLVLSDVVLGGRMTGARLINRIRRQEPPKGNVPILAVTAFDTQARRVELFHLGIDDYVAKPIFPAELQARIHNLISRKRATERNRDLLTATELGVTLIDDEGFILSMDDNAKSMFGLLGENDARYFATLLVSDHEQAVSLESLRWLILEQGVKRLRFDGVRGEQTFPLLLSSLEIDPAEGSRRFAILTRDISEEQALADHLSQARDTAERLSRMKAEFLANMSHELRTPLNAVIGISQLLMDDGLAPEVVERIGMIDSAGRHLLGLVDDILDFSKIESGKLELESVAISIPDLLREVMSMTEQRATAKGLKLKIRADGVSMLLCGDPGRLKQALLNYLSNAVKFTEQGEISVRASVAEVTEGHVMVRFEVADTGIGVAPEHLDGIFDSFRQADSSNTRRYGGAGLGLAITRELATLMGGQTGVTSFVGRGSVFWFTARFARSADISVDVDTGSASPVDIIAHRYSGAPILLVEDEPVNRELALAYLSVTGLKVDVAEDGLSAVKAVSEKPYRLVLMDIQMPHMDGLQATQLIRSMPDLARLPIVALTANAFEGDRKRCFDAGMDDFIPKPVDTRLLYSVILRHLEGGMANSTAPAMVDGTSPEQRH